MSSDILRQLAQFDTALLANTVEALKPSSGHEWYMAGTIQSVTPELGPTVGVAYTCELDSSTPGGEPEMDEYWEVSGGGGERRKARCVGGEDSWISS